MRVIAFNGSPHASGNTARLLREVERALAEHGVACATVWTGDAQLRQCTACGACATAKGRGHCAITDDPFNAWIELLAAADGALFASPTHAWGMPPAMQALVSRLYQVCRNAGERGPLFRKAAAPVIAARREGGEIVYYQMLTLFAAASAVMPTSTYWNIGLGAAEQDEQGLSTMFRLGHNLAWLLERLQSEKAPEAPRGGVQEVRP